MASSDRLLAGYSYRLNANRIAQVPASPRDSAKLLVYRRRTRVTAVNTFRHLGQHLPPGAVLVFNQTKVVPARIEGTKETGGRVRLLALRWTKRTIEVLADRKIAVGQTVRVSGHMFRVRTQHGAEFELQALAPVNILGLLSRHGTAPIPPYIKHSPLTRSQLRSRYQTIFAKTPGSVAAPTASLHFTLRLLRSLRRSGTRLEFVTLHVNLGTFAPVTSQQIRQHKLHQESYAIEPAVAARLNRYKAAGRPIIAVGTTVARTLESAARNGRLRAGQRTTDIFIRPGYRWKFVDGLITNFHVPRSSLLMLVASLIGRQELLRLYRQAQRKNFRFFSFGDGMLIRP